MRQYLKMFVSFKIGSLRSDKKEGDFFKFLELLPAEGDYLDVGANLGIMTHFLAQKAAVHNGTVHAFEPVKENLDTLAWVVKKYKHKNVATHPTAVGDTAGELTMVMPKVKGVRMQGLSHVQDPSIEGYDETASTYQVPVVRLDDLPQLQRRRITGIKLDVENFEARVLEGARELIAREKPLIYCELWDNDNRQQSFQIVRELGYSVQVLDETGELQAFDPQQHKQQNFFFLPA